MVTRDGEPMPVLFCAHGSPMNALGGTDFTRFLQEWGRELPRPRAILAVSAHWEEAKSTVTASPRPPTVHDFYGFPADMYDLRYPAPGSPELAERVRGLLAEARFEAAIEAQRGLDHGVWSPLLHLAPRADIPLVQLSQLAGVPLWRHVEVGRALAPLREEGILIFASGNLVHNLRTADMRRAEAPPSDWAVAFDRWVAEKIDTWNLDALAAFRESAPFGERAHPTPEHFTPLLVACGAADPNPRVQHAYEGFEHGTIAMRCLRFD